MSSERDSAGAPAGAEAPAAIPERWSAQRKADLVLRLLRGEALDAVARDSQVPAHELEEWRRVFLDGGTQGLKKRVNPEEQELKRVHPHGDPAHAGTITTERPNVMWGTDATRFYTEREGWCWFFGAIDHASDDIVGWHVAEIGDCWAALEPIHQGVRAAFGAFGKDIARGLAVRSDWGPQYVADAFRAELAWLGITHSPSFVSEPQCNGVIERFMRTLKEQCLWLHRFDTLDQAQTIISAFIERYNHEWLIERLGHRTPATARREMLAMAA